MEVIYPRCAGLDVHKQTVVACVRIAGDGAPCAGSAHLRHHHLGAAGPGRLARELRRRARRDGGHRRVLEAGVARARRPFRAGAGQRRARQERARAQDRRQRRDVARRPAGPRPDPRQLRAAAWRCRSCATLTRTRKQFVRERSAHVQRIEKVLEDANLKLGVVLTDIMGKSGRAVLQAIIDGQRRSRSAWPRCVEPARQGHAHRAARSAARTRQRASPLHAQAASGPHRGARSGHRRHRAGGGQRARSPFAPPPSC